ncbi:MAG: Fic family protein [Coriobacteriales bacterium]|jgi:Fic family protein|nr:Fic family protein [Coriobacteriales bacterium]
MGDELGRLLREVDRKKMEMTERPDPAPEAQEAYEERFLFESVYFNNTMEGNQLTYEEVEAVLKNDLVIAGKPLSDHMSLVGYRDAMQLAQQYVIQNRRIGEHELLRLHSRILIDKPEIAGEYRLYNLMIKGHRPTSYEKIGTKMHQLVEKRAPEYAHPVESAAYFHLRLEKIHPFGDGNGRVGRLIINIMLEQAGLPPVIIREGDRQEYYEALNAYDGLDGNRQVLPMQLHLAGLVIRHIDEITAL